jgi:hypothetical protein
MAVEPENLLRLRLQRWSLIVAVLGFAWALALIASGGFDFEFMGQRVRSTDALRPLLAAVVALGIYVISGGERAQRKWFASLSSVDERLLAAILAAATLGVGVACSTTAAAGADAYGYVNQADQWLSGDLVIDQPWVAELPWPSRGWSSSPLAYKPIEVDGRWAIVPTYSPGFPLLMAAAKAVAGHGAMFWIVPLCGAVVVFATFGLGKRLGSGRIGLIGAWLTVTSPPFVLTLILPWSDVPATAAWAVALYFLFGNTAWTAAGAGLATAVAVLIRPNLVWAAAVLGLWFVVRLWSAGSGKRPPVLADGIVFSATAGLGILAVALIYQHLYGSPFESGYGRFSDNFRLTRIAVNAPKYVEWLVETKSGLSLAGIAALAVPLTRLWPGVPDRRVFIPLAAFVFGLWLMYCSYLEFDGWGYLRFLLPAYPLMMIGVGAIALAWARSRGPGTALAITGLVVVIGVFLQFRMVVKSGTLGLEHTEQRYVSAGQLTRAATDDNSVVFSLDHRGTARYYGGRMTLRYVVLEPEWLDRSIQWLAERGVHPYLLVEERELAAFQQRFAGQHAVLCTEGNPVFSYEGQGTVVLFDLLSKRHEPPQRVQATTEHPRAVPPAPEATLQLKTQRVLPNRSCGARLPLPGS